MKVRFAVAPQSGSLTGAHLLEFAGAVEVSAFDGIWLSDLPVAAVLDPLLGLALAAGQTRGWAGVARRRLNGWAGSLTAGWARS